MTQKYLMRSTPLERETASLDKSFPMTQSHIPADLFPQQHQRQDLASLSQNACCDIARACGVRL
jgi:hypothetical protein